MTLFKQIFLLLSTFLLIVLTTVMLLSFKSANQATQERLYEEAKNTATSLSLTLGTSKGDVSMMSTMINASFDSGNYKMIKLVDVDDKVLYERQNDTHIDVPDWFYDSVHLSSPIASANVSSGWSQVGILIVQSSNAYAYRLLYQTLKELLISFGIIAIFAIIVLHLIISAILKPLKKVLMQAEAIVRNEFIIQDKIPYTKEFKEVVKGMNSMVHKVKIMFDKGNEELKKYTELEFKDKATGLKSRKYFIDKLPKFLKIDASYEGGINMLIAFHGVIEANEKIGRQNVNNLFVDLANIFKKYASEHKDSIASRMNGTEFSIFLPNCDEEILEVAHTMVEEVKELISKHKLNNNETYISVGLYRYNYRQSINELLSLSDNALSRAKFEASHVYLDMTENSCEVMGKEAWRNLINEALELNNFYYTTYNAIDTKNKTVAHKVLSLSLKTSDNQIYSYGQFMASANQVGLNIQIYKNTISSLFKTPDAKLKDSVCSLRLSSEYLEMIGTYDELSYLINKYASNFEFKLILEMPDNFICQNHESIMRYKTLFEKHNIDIGIYEFIGESADYRYLQDLRPIYIKANEGYFLTQNEHTLSALRLVTDTVGITLIATGVLDAKTLKALHEKDIYTIQGKVTDDINLS